MSKFIFFIDTADAKYILEKWKQYKNDVDPKRFLGITTNPNVFHKENLTSLTE